MGLAAKLAGLREAGEFPMRVLDVSKDPSKAGNPMLTVQFKELEGDRGICAWYVFSEKAKPYSLEKIQRLKQALGLPDSAVADDFIGKKCIVEVGLQAPNAEGKVYSEVKSVRAYVEGFQGKRKMSVDDSLDALMGESSKPTSSATEEKLPF